MVFIILLISCSKIIVVNSTALAHYSSGVERSSWLMLLRGVLCHTSLLWLSHCSSRPKSWSFAVDAVATARFRSWGRRRQKALLFGFVFFFCFFFYKIGANRCISFKGSLKKNETCVLLAPKSKLLNLKLTQFCLFSTLSPW